MKPRQIPPPDPSVKFTELTPLQLNALHLADKRTLRTLLTPQLLEQMAARRAAEARTSAGDKTL